MPLCRHYIRCHHRCSPIFAPIPPHRLLPSCHLPCRNPSLHGRGLEGVGGGARCHRRWLRSHRPNSLPSIVVVLRPPSCCLPSATALITVAVSHQHTHLRRHQPSPSTINTLIAVAVNHRRQPSTHSLPLPSTINELIAVAVNHQHTLCRCHQPSTHSSPSPSTINALIAVAVNHQHTHRRRRNHQRTHHHRPQPSTHSSPLPSTIAVNHQHTHCRRQ